MSSRAIRKLERQKEKENELQSKEEVESEVEDSGNVNKTASFNAFSFLNEESDEVDEQEKQQLQQPEPVVEPQSVKLPTKNKKKNKKKSKKSTKSPPVDSDDELDKILEEAKKKDQVKYPQQEPSQDQPETTIFDFEEEYNELQDGMENYDSNFKNFTTERLVESLSVLSVDSVKNLDPDEELKGLFGNLSLETIEDANTTTSLAMSPDVLNQYKRIARLTKGWGGKERKNVPGTTRKLLLTRIRDDWLPTSQKPMQMEELPLQKIVEYLDYKEDTAEYEDLELKIKKEKNLGVKYFNFNKNNSVQERVATTQFYASVVMSPDHDALIALLRNYPYHAETLLQVSMVILRQGNDKATSNALLEKCLFVFDRSFHSSFHELLLEAKTGLIRLPYESFMNRQFYLCIFRYIVSLAERSTFFTAFSYCKLLLSFSPGDDPLGVRYFIDFYALMSQEYSYLIKLVESPVVQSYKKWFTPGLSFSVVLAHLELGHQEKATQALKTAFEAHPYTAYRLLQDIGLPDKMPINESDIHVNDEIELATETYMVRAKVLWNDAEKRRFLNDQLCHLFTHLKVNSNTNLPSFMGFFRSFGKQSPAKPGSNEIPFNLIRFAILSGENSLMAKIPTAIWNRDDIFEYDVLPPKNSTLNYSETQGINNSKLVEGMLDFVDQNVLGSIIQNRTEHDEFDDIVRNLQHE